MNIVKTKIEGVVLMEPRILTDDRGYFLRAFAKEVLKEQGISYLVKHVNRSFTKKKGTIRGMHYQVSPFGEDKIVQCLRGSIFDVAVDLREGSKTFGKWVGEILDEKNGKTLLIPKGFAHGFQALENNVLVEYFVTQVYTPKAERGIKWNDPSLKIKWPIQNALVSEKDSSWPLLKI